MIFAIRLITSICFFALLAKANIWLTPLCNTILAVGYRIFLIMSPIFSRISNKFAISLSLFISTIGIFLFFSSTKNILVLGALLFGVGISVSGYLIRYAAAETIKGAAHNKIAANLGSLLAGILLLFTFIPKDIFLLVIALMIAISCILSVVSAHKQKEVVLNFPKKPTVSRLFGWGLLGIALGIKLFSVFSVLPQYLLSKLGNLPSWYGIMIFTNSIIIIVAQLPTIHFIEKYYSHIALKLTLLAMLFGMLLIAFPAFFHIELLLGAFCWVILLSIVECIASYLDVEGAKANCLLIKELSVGIGAGLAVLISRELPSQYSSMILGLLGILSIVIACILLRIVNRP